MSQAIPPADHRARLLLGLAQAIAEQGYRSTTVADIVRNARTSRRTFYEHFSDRDACFRELGHLATSVLREHMRKAIDPSQPWEQRVDAAIAAYLEAVANSPAVAVALHRETAILIGEDEEGGRDGILETAHLVAELFEQTSQEGEPIGPISIEAAIAITAGLSEIITRTIEAGGDLRALRPLATGMVCSIATTEAARANYHLV